MRHGKGQIDTPAMTDAAVLRADTTLQNEVGQGPCLDAIYRDDTYVTDDMQTEQRWPEWAFGAAGLGLRGVLSIRWGRRSALSVA